MLSPPSHTIWVPPTSYYALNYALSILLLNWPKSDAIWTSSEKWTFLVVLHSFKGAMNPGRYCLTIWKIDCSVTWPRVTPPPWSTLDQLALWSSPSGVGPAKASSSPWFPSAPRLEHFLSSAGPGNTAWCSLWHLFLFISCLALVLLEMGSSLSTGCNWRLPWVSPSRGQPSCT